MWVWQVANEIINGLKLIIELSIKWVRSYYKEMNKI